MEQFSSANLKLPPRQEITEMSSKLFEFFNQLNDQAINHLSDEEFEEYKKIKSELLQARFGLHVLLEHLNQITIRDYSRALKDPG